MFYQFGFVLLFRGIFDNIITITLYLPSEKAFYKEWNAKTEHNGIDNSNNGIIITKYDLRLPDNIHKFFIKKCNYQTNQYDHW